jgi:CRP/FNR family transcriptional regulator, cyclic AMP receptor protein
MARQNETLARIPLFRSLSADAIEKLNTRCSWRRVTSGQWLLDYQDASSNVYFVVSGAVRVVIQSAGREVLLRQINAGEFFGELAAIDHVPRSSGIVAMMDVTIACMSAAAFRDLVHAHPDVCDQLLALLASQIRMLANRVNEFTTLHVRRRIYAELLRLSRPKPSNKSCTIISPPPVHTEIAVRVSTRRQAVAREFKALDRGRPIERRRGAIALTDVDRLRRLTNEAIELD